MMERWLPIDDYPAYEISDHGNVRRITAPKAGPGCKKTVPYLLKPCQATTGYLIVSLLNENGRTRRFVHTLVAEAFLGRRPSPQHEVAHGDGTRTNNKVENLRWATPSENCLDRVRHGTMKRGETHRLTTLTAAQVREIKAGARNGRSLGWGRAMARKYGVTEFVISSIVTGRTWKHV